MLTRRFSGPEVALTTPLSLGFPRHCISQGASPTPRAAVPYLGVTRVSSSEGCRMRQVVKVKVELVCDMHFPGWCAKLGTLGEGGDKT